jgi:hypothetical protein
MREKMRAKPRTRALFVFVSKSRQPMRVTWDGTGVDRDPSDEQHQFPGGRQSTASESEMVAATNHPTKPRSPIVSSH